MKIVRLLVIVWLAGGVLACGQKGPLLMPDAQKHKRTISTPVRAPAKTTAHPAPAEAPPAGLPARTPTPTDSSSRP
ncbi:MAG: lipoprotein [Pseudomonadota bacterium]|nr:lipoprotein [Pseudomonadota bacterium]